MENKTTLTFSYAGEEDESFYLTLSSRLAEMLSNSVVEWKHTYGRNTHNLKLRSKVLPLTQVLLDRKDLITKPYFHIFWVDCTDSNHYTHCVRGKISLWLDQLAKCKNISWMLVVLVNDVLTRITKAKLPLMKAAIVDKIKVDFCQKHPEKIYLLHEATKESTKSAESWQTLVTKVALATVKSMESQVSVYEEKVRSERERRNEKSWDFCSYFIMQEELAFMYEMLGMFSSALVQYDELDAMFTQYIVNAKSGEIAHWLSRFSERPITNWNSLLLLEGIDTEARSKIIKGIASLVDVRNYLFGRLCHLLFKMKRFSDVTDRMYYFLHSISSEVKILEIGVVEGSVDCWTFMCALELNIALRQSEDSTNGHVNGESTENCESNLKSFEDKNKKMLLEKAVLWNIARDKLFSLGKLCGMLPGPKTTSDQLQKVVELLSGMGSDEERHKDIKSPNTVCPFVFAHYFDNFQFFDQILREALSSKSNFKRHYFELAELAMGTFKHMGRYRAARNIGAQLAEFYQLDGEAGQGQGYLFDWAKMFARDGWSRLCFHANEKLALCYKQADDVKKYMCLCHQLMCEDSVDHKKRLYYCDELVNFARKTEEEFALNLSPMLTIISFRFVSGRLHFQRNSTEVVEVDLQLHSPQPILFDRVELGVDSCLQLDYPHRRGRRRQKGLSRNISNTSNVVQVANDSDDEVLDTSVTSINSTSTNEISQNCSFRRRYKSSSSSYNMKDRLYDSVVMNENGLIKMNNPHSTKIHYNEVLKCFDEKITNKNSEGIRNSIYCRNHKSYLRRQDSSHSQFYKNHVIKSKPIVFERCEQLVVVNNVSFQPGRNQIQFQLQTDQSATFKIAQFRVKIGSLYFVDSHLSPNIRYTINDQKPTIHIETCQSESKIYSGVPFSLQVTVNLGDRHLLLESNRTLKLSSSNTLSFLQVSKCTITSSEGVETQAQMTSSSISTCQSNSSIILPPAQAGSKILLQIICIKNLSENLHLADNHVTTHRRTHSAPVTILQSSPKPHGLTPNPPRLLFEDTSSLDDLPKRTSLSSSTTSLYKFHESSESDKSEEIIESFLDEDLSDVSLDDESEEEVKPKSKLMSIQPKMMDKMMGFLTPKKRNSTSTVSSSFSKHSYHIRSLSAEPSDKIRKQLNKPNKNYPRLDVPEVRIVESSVRSSVKFADLKVSIKDIWTDVDDCHLQLAFKPSLAFIQSWNFSDSAKRYLSLNVENLTDQVVMMTNPCLSTSEANNLIKLLNKTHTSYELRPDHSCTFVWQFPSIQSNDIIRCIFHVDLNSHLSPIKKYFQATYSFELENTQTIYSVSCHQSLPNQTVRCGVMTSLTVDVTRIRNDEGHTTTNAGQQLLMFQGGWAVCGKTSGILTFPGPCPQSSAPPNVTIDINVMPLLSGFLHFPYILLHRYVKRSSELDEKLSSTDSPVLKPPKLQSFAHGEVFYKDQSLRVHVLPHDQLDSKPHLSDA